MADKSESGALEIEQFVNFYKMLTQRDEVWKVFQDYSGDGEKLMLDELEDFLRLEQQEGERSAQHARELIERYEPSQTGKEKWDRNGQDSNLLHFAFNASIGFPNKLLITLVIVISVQPRSKVPCL